ncbi:MAG: hypothetical protein LBR34_03270 [Prevotella sp.]|jgi:hypothetical protein|nr:hypothetical protein [Prevotella sp.]
MEKNRNITDEKQDKLLRELFAASKTTAGENLKYRVMQQLQTESLLAKSYDRKEKRVMRQIGSLLAVAGVTYVLIIAVIAFNYIRFGMELLSQPGFYLTMAFIVGVAILFGFISIYDEKLRAKSRTRK